MSLINEALKKAQRQRSLENAPLAAAPSGVAAAAVATHVPTASRRASRAPLWFGLGLLVMGSVATAVIMRFGFPADPAPASPAARQNIAATPPATPPAANPPPPAPLQNQAAAPTPTVSPAPVALPPPPPPPAPVVAPPSSPPPSAPAVAVSPLPTKSAATAPAASAPPVVPPPPARAAAQSSATSSPPPLAVSATPAAPTPPDPRIRDRLASLRITGVRGTGRDARVLINERVWRIGEVVLPDLNLTLSAVQPGRLIFQDAAGRVYERSL